MTAAVRSTGACVVSRLMPVLWQDDHFVALYKPPRINLEAAVRKHGPTVIEAALEAGRPGRTTLPSGPTEKPLALVLPERLASGVALFAKTPEGRRRFADTAAAHKLQFVHTAVLKGSPLRAKIAVKAGGGRAAQKAARRGRKRPLAPLLPARIEIIRTRGEYHVARCTTSAASLEDVRRCFKAAGGLSIVGDLLPRAPLPGRRTRKSLRTMLHLESLSFLHPFANRHVTVHARTPDSFGAFLTARQVPDDHLQASLALRTTCLLDERTDCFRLFTGRHEGVSGLVAEKLGPVVVLELLQGKYQGDEAQLRRVADWYTRVLGAQTVYEKRCPRRRDDSTAAEQGGRRLISLLKGAPTDEVCVTENGIKYLVRPAAGLSVGLFLDQRENRRRIRAMAEGKSALNLFAYTCGFSVAAASGGARSTTSVDLTVANLEWGKRNFALNGIPLDDHTFIRGDAFGHCRRARRQGERFDIIILDPPSFSRSKRPRRTFEVKKNLVELLAAAIELLNSGGHVLVSTNNRRLTTSWLAQQVETAAGARRCEIIARPKLSADFAPDRDYQKSLIVQLG